MHSCGQLTQRWETLRSRRSQQRWRATSCQRYRGTVAESGLPGRYQLAAVAETARGGTPLMLSSEGLPRPVVQPATITRRFQSSFSSGPSVWASTRAFCSR